MSRALYSNSITFVDIDNDGDPDGFTGEGDQTTDLYIEGGTIVILFELWNKPDIMLPQQLI